MDYIKYKSEYPHALNRFFKWCNKNYNKLTNISIVVPNHSEIEIIQPELLLVDYFFESIGFEVMRVHNVYAHLYINNTKYIQVAKHVLSITNPEQTSITIDLEEQNGEEIAFQIIELMIKKNLI
jgi:hypothetical protein